MQEVGIVTPEFRSAISDDLAAIIAMLADDLLGQSREKPGVPLDVRYLDAFAAILADPNQMPLVATINGAIAGYLQISFIPGLSRLGAWRGQIESVRVSAAFRGQRVGEALIRSAIEICERRGCEIVQLTTDKKRADALRFYERLGFEATHEGMKRTLSLGRQTDT